MTKENFSDHFDISNLGSSERRRSARHIVTAAAEVMEPHSHLRIAARTTDLDHQGCYIETYHPFPEGVNVVLRIAKENQTFNTMATVVYAQTGMGMGVVFDTLAPEQSRILDVWIAKLTGDAQPRPQPAPKQPAGNQPLAKVPVAKAFEQQSAEVLKYLVLMLVQKGVLVELEGQALLERLLN
jgi:PilZ domain